MKRFSVIGLCALVLALVCVIPSFRTDSALRNRLVVTALGFHHAETGYTVSAQGVDSLKTASSLSEQEGSATAVYTSSAPSVDEALYDLAERAGRRPFWRQNTLLVLSESFCRDTELDTGATAEPRLPVAVCRDDPRSLLELASGNDAIPARDTVRMLKEGAKGGRCVYRTFLDLERARSGMWDAVLPILTVHDERPAYDGTALFKNGRLVGTLDIAQTAVLCLLIGEADTIPYTMGDTWYTIENPKMNLTIEQNGNHFRYHITVTATSDAAITAALERDIRAVLNRLDEFRCDPLGLARQTALHYTDVTQKTVSSQLASCEKTVQVLFD